MRALAPPQGVQGKFYPRDSGPGNMIRGCPVDAGQAYRDAEASIHERYRTRLIFRSDSVDLPSWIVLSRAK